MTKRRTRRTRVAKKLPEPTPEIEEIEEVEEVEEVEDVEPVRKTRTRRKPAPEVEEVEDVEPVRKTRTRRKSAAVKAVERVKGTTTVRTRRKPVPEVEDEDTAAEAAKLGTVVRSEFAKALFEVIDGGLVLVLKRVGNKIIVYKAGAEGIIAPVAPIASPAAKPRVISVKAMREFAYTDDYKELQEWWPQLAFEDKVKEAEEIELEWVEHDDPTINNMRLTMAYMKAMEITKWKPEYKAKATRHALLQNGLPTE